MVHAIASSTALNAYHWRIQKGGGWVITPPPHNITGHNSINRQDNITRVEWGGVQWTGIGKRMIRWITITKNPATMLLIDIILCKAKVFIQANANSFVDFLSLLALH